MELDDILTLGGYVAGAVAANEDADSLESVEAILRDGFEAWLAQTDIAKMSKRGFLLQLEAVMRADHPNADWIVPWAKFDADERLDD